MTGDADRALRYWDRAAGAYGASRRDGPLALSSIYEPVIDELLGDVTDKRVLDAGCGDGLYARKLVARGASVTAVDGSSEMIKLALRDTQHPNIEYRVGDLMKPLPPVGEGRGAGLLGGDAAFPPTPLGLLRRSHTQRVRGRRLQGAHAVRGRGSAASRVAAPSAHSVVRRRAGRLLETASRPVNRPQLDW